MLEQILQKYWGYSVFRPLQKEIIESVLAGNDTLALLPTGGGKSICFQIPALALEGMCLVISPLIALMKDQVEQLQKRDIAAEAIYSGMEWRMIDKVLDEAVNSKLKFLYISPERLKTAMFVERAKRMKISLLAVDEAHCISQWGYDFRPLYLDIAEFRHTIPQVPVIALTATATEIVKRDIQEKLQFNNPNNVFQKSFARENLSYSTFKVEDKERKMLDILQKVAGTAVVYVRNRRKTQEIAEFLQKNGISADYYHAGLSNQWRSNKQDNWLQNRTRVMVATNAFGMGIDKPEVRVVIHWDLPDSLEAYYQEAGRAGRDEKKAYAVALYHAQDLEDLNTRTLLNYPEADFVKTIYQALANYFHLPTGAGEYSSYDFDLAEFQRTFNFTGTQAFYALKLLESEGLIEFNESFHNPAQVMFTLGGRGLYEFQMKHPKAEPIIRVLQRIYGEGIQNHLVNISERSIAHYLQVSDSEIVKQLNRLQDYEVVVYSPVKEKAQITFLSPRYEVANLPLDLAKIEQRKQRDLAKIKAVKHYVEHPHRCRTQLLLEYFGEISDYTCGVCDNCLKKKKAAQTPEAEVGSHTEKISQILTAGALAPRILVQKLQPLPEKEALQIIRQMLDIGLLQYLEDGRLSLS
ncbi:MAG: RecQ family ATP-dependent DNA helicase [Microscillaceae bacterium]|jgi:ATP-dependent DNA helicase RecQ|nr:RecQ family ATP-dependent DNA helicase [Microscillaceae bacterium]